MKNEFSEKKLKLHLGCGSVYLTNYLNIDSPSNNRACLAYRRPDLVDQW